MRYKEIFNKYGVTQIEVANRLGINRVSLSRLISDNNSNIGCDTLRKIAKAVGCKVTEFFDEEDQCNKQPEKQQAVCPNCGGKLYITISGE